MKKSIGFLKYALKMVLVKGEWFDLYDKHGPFTEESYEKWLDTQLGEVDWDRLEW